MNDRKYRQRGYMEGDREREQRSKAQPVPARVRARVRLACQGFERRCGALPAAS